ncbi:MAG: hypothetical protein WCI51_08120 [Lentisphaerota bacterium]
MSNARPWGGFVPLRVFSWLINVFLCGFATPAAGKCLSEKKDFNLLGNCGTRNLPQRKQADSDVKTGTGDVEIVSNSSAWLSKILRT